MLDSIITSKTRIKLLLKFFLNSRANAYLRSLESEFGDSTNAIRIELNRLENAGLLNSETKTNKKIYSANTLHPLYLDIHNILLKFVGIDKIIDEVVTKMGDVQRVYLTGAFAKGLDSMIIDLMIVSDQIDKDYLLKLIEKVEKHISRKIRYLIFSSIEVENYIKSINEDEIFLIWEKD